MDPATIALLLKAALTGIPMLLQEYNIAKSKDNYTPEQRAELDGLIESFKSKDYWQE